MSYTSIDGDIFSRAALPSTRITINGESAGTFGEFYAANREAFDDGEFSEIKRALEHHGRFEGGGGAFAGFVIAMEG